MIYKKSSHRTEKRVIGGGSSEITLLHRAEKDDMFGKCRLCAELVIEPGQSIGDHAHVNDMEIFYVLEGELVSLNPDGTTEAFTQGDVMVTGGGAHHSLRNDGDHPAVLFAVIAL